MIPEHVRFLLCFPSFFSLLGSRHSFRFEGGQELCGELFAPKDPADQGGDHVEAAAEARQPAALFSAPV